MAASHFTFSTRNRRGPRGDKATEVTLGSPNRRMLPLPLGRRGQVERQLEPKMEGSDPTEWGPHDGRVILSAGSRVLRCLASGALVSWEGQGASWRLS